MTQVSNLSLYTHHEYDDPLFVHDIHSGKRQQILPSMKRVNYVVAKKASLLFYHKDYKKIYKKDLRNNSQVLFIENEHPIRNIKLNTNGTILAISTFENQTVFLRHPKQQENLYTRHPIWQDHWSQSDFSGSDNIYIFNNGNDIYIWNIRTRTKLFHTTRQNAYCILHPNNQFLVVKDQKHVDIYNIHKKTHLYRYYFDKFVRNILFDKYGERLIVQTDNKTHVIYFDVQALQSSQQFGIHPTNNIKQWLLDDPSKISKEIFGYTVGENLEVISANASFCGSKLAS